MFILTYPNSIQKPVLVGIFQSRADAEARAAILSDVPGNIAPMSIEPVKGVRNPVIDPLAPFRDISGT